MKTTTRPHTSFAKLLTVLGLSVAVLPQVALAAQTYCQQNGHGANGCTDLFANGGYCWVNTDSPTGYVCREDDPNAEVSPHEQEIAPSQDPVLFTPGETDDPGVQALEIVICGPDDGAGCFTWAIPDVCCEDIGLPYNEPVPAGSGTITCYD